MCLVGVVTLDSLCRNLWRSTVFGFTIFFRSGDHKLLLKYQLSGEIYWNIPRSELPIELMQSMYLLQLMEMNLATQVPWLDFDLSMKYVSFKSYLDDVGLNVWLTFSLTRHEPK